MTYTLPDELSVRAPMKLVVAGEYAVLESGVFGVVVAVDRHVTCTASIARDGVAIEAPSLGPGSVRSPEIGPSGELRFESAGGDGARKLHFARIAAELAYRHVAALGLKLRPLALRCEDAGGSIVLDSGERRKLGLGTSAAATVATVGAVLGAHGIPIDRTAYRRQALRLALAAHARAQGGHGSGIDVGASALGGLLEYGRADPSWVRRIERAMTRIGAGMAASVTVAPPASAAADAQAAVLEVARGAWPGLHVDPLPAPPGLRLLVGFTGDSASTPELIEKVDAWKRDRQPEHANFMRMSMRATQALSGSLRKGDRNGVLAAILLARKALGYLALRAGVRVETPALEKLATIAADAGGAGKLSGAGGGDCGIAVAFDDATARKIEEGWRAAGIVPVPLAIAPNGMQELRPEAAGAR
jgi:phosphomevalonate kinase